MTATGKGPVAGNGRRMREARCRGHGNRPGAATVAAAQILVAPRSFWELDEVLFARGVMDFDPLSHHPHPPATHRAWLGIMLFLRLPFRWWFDCGLTRRHPQ